MSEQNFNTQEQESPVFSATPEVQPQTRVVTPAPFERSEHHTKIKIKIIGVGGAGGNIINYMVNKMQFPTDIVSFYATNTDAEALDAVNVPLENKIYLHDKNSDLVGHGAGANPEVAQNAAENSKVEITEKLAGAHMIFAVGGLGKGTGTGALPYITELATKLQDPKPVVVVGVTTPFELEGKKRRDAAEGALAELYRQKLSIIKIPNEKIYNLDHIWTMEESINESDSAMGRSILGITDIIDNRGKTNLDFKDILSNVIDYPGNTLIGTGSAAFPEGYRVDKENKEIDQTPIMLAVRRAVEQDLIDNFSFKEAQGLIVNFIVPSQRFLSKNLFREALRFASAKTQNENISIMYGIVYQNELPPTHRNYLDPENTDQELEVKITVIATGIPDEIQNKQPVMKEQNTVLNNVNNVQREVYYAPTPSYTTVNNPIHNHQPKAPETVIDQNHDPFS